MPQHYRALFISDVHLGTRWMQAGKLLDFLAHVRADTIYLVGDIVDFWRIGRGVVWPAPHTDVLKWILARSRDGARIVYLPGNHDERLKAYHATRFGRIEIEHTAVHTTATGKRYLVTHGDDHDVVTTRAHWLALVGDRSYAAALGFNRVFNWGRRLVGKEYWSISAYLKQRVKACVSRVGQFETLLAAEAVQHDACGVICGHIHNPSTQMIGDIHYINIGDWVESCTALVETANGELQLIGWPDGALPVGSPHAIGATA